MDFYSLGQKAIKNGVPFDKIASLPIRNEISRAKYIPENNIEKIDEMDLSLRQEIEDLMEGRV